MKFCKICGAKLEDDAKFCVECGSDVKDNNEVINEKNEEYKTKSNNKVILISIIITIIIISILGVGFLNRKNIMYAYYNKKGDSSTTSKTSVEYYIKALDYKYTNDIINKISDKIQSEDNFEDILNILRGTINEADLSNLYIKIYVSKAKESFNNKNYETTWKYLNKASEYNYNIERFEYYGDLLKYTENEDKTQKEVVKQDTHIYINKTPSYTNYYNYYDYFIIPDSDSRYLTKSELYGYDKYTLSLIRNEIFARHGYIFKKDEYRNYFNSMPWYTPNSSFKGSLNELNAIEKYNVELIKSLE